MILTNEEQIRKRISIMTLCSICDDYQGSCESDPEEPMPILGETGYCWLGDGLDIKKLQDKIINLMELEHKATLKAVGKLLCETTDSVSLSRRIRSLQEGAGMMECELYGHECKQNGWISVEDELPEPYTTVIISGGCGFITEGGVWCTYMERNYWGARDAVVQWEVTHWMPLPEPPKESE